MIHLPKQYIVKPQPVKAMLLTKDNLEAAALWCGGVEGETVKPGDPSDAYRYLRFPTLDGPMTADLGEYLVQTEDGKFHTLSAKVFDSKYEQRGVRETPKDLPAPMPAMRRPAGRYVDRYMAPGPMSEEK